ncbi:MFS transporter, partial [Lactobacillus crispatus]|uniref:MFS transporter n=1 Tax=Lactobacillus crispatus TaxID=47770 RepID=UPI0011AF48FD
MSSKQKVYPWVVDVSMGLLTAVVVDTFLSLMGYFLLPLVKSMHANLSIVSLFYTVVVIAMSLTFPIAGKLVEKINLNLLTVGGVILAAGAAFMLSKATNLFIFFAMAALIGICSGFCGLVVQGIVVNNWFEKKHTN